MLAPDVPIKIITSLYLGNYNAARYENLVNPNIRAVVCVTNSCHHYPDTVNLLHIDDISETLAEESFSVEKLIRAVDFIKININNNNNVLVHCRAGASRSPTVIIAYIMQENNLNPNEAIDFVSQRAKHINPTFIKLLNEYYDILSL